MRSYKKVYLVLMFLLIGSLFMEDVYRTVEALEGSESLYIGTSTNRNQSGSITVPDLYSVDDVSVDTGNVSYRVSGDRIDFNVSGGSWVSRSRISRGHYKTETYTYTDTCTRNVRESYRTICSRMVTETYSSTCTRNVTETYYVTERRTCGVTRTHRCRGTSPGGSIVYSHGPYSGGCFRGGRCTYPKNCSSSTRTNYCDVRVQKTRTVSETYSCNKTRRVRDYYYCTRYRTVSENYSCTKTGTRDVWVDTSYWRYRYGYNVDVDYTTNVAPDINVQDYSNKVYTNDEGNTVIHVSGRIRDIDGNSFGLTATLDGVKKSASFSRSGDGWRDFEFVWDVVEDGISSGSHAQITLRAEDELGAVETETVSGPFEVIMPPEVEDLWIDTSGSEAVLNIEADAKGNGSSIVEYYVERKNVTDGGGYSELGRYSKGTIPLDDKGNKIFSYRVGVTDSDGLYFMEKDKEANYVTRPRLEYYGVLDEDQRNTVTLRLKEALGSDDGVSVEMSRQGNLVSILESGDEIKDRHLGFERSYDYRLVAVAEYNGESLVSIPVEVEVDVDNATLEVGLDRDIFYRTIFEENALISGFASYRHGGDMVITERGGAELVRQSLSPYVSSRWSIQRVVEDGGERTTLDLKLEGYEGIHDRVLRVDLDTKDVSVIDLENNEIKSEYFGN